MLDRDQLPLMLSTLRDVFLDHPQGLQIDPILSSTFADGLRDMERCAHACLQAEIAVAETIGDVAEDLRQASEYFRTCVRSQIQPSVNDCLDWMRFFSGLAVRLERLHRPPAETSAPSNVIPFPVIPRPRPMPIEGGCA